MHNNNIIVNDVAILLDVHVQQLLWQAHVVFSGFAN